MALPPQSPTVTAAPPDNLAEVLARLEADPRIDASRRRDFRGAVRTLAAILGREPTAIPAQLSGIDRLITAVPKAVHRRADKTIANLRSRVKRAILQGTGSGQPTQRGQALAPRWNVLRDRLPTPRLRNGLSRLIRAASASGADPQQVSDGLVGRIAAQVAATRGEAGARVFQRQVADCWNEAARSVPGWPAIRLSRPGPATRKDRLPLDAFPISFQRDVERYLAWAAESGRLARDGSPRSLAPGTVRLRREHLRLAASALARRLGYTRRVINLATLVEPVNFKLIIAEYLEAAGDGRSGSFLKGLAVTLFGVARQWVKAPASQLDQLGQLKRRLGGSTSGMAAASRRLIEPFEDPRVLAELLALPERLLAQSADGRMPRARALRKAQVAVAVQLLLVAPMRLHRLAALRIGLELRRPPGLPGPTSIVLARDGDGRDTPLEYPVAGHALQVVDEFLERFHRDDAARADRWLFERPGGGPVTAAALRDGIARETGRALGIALTPGRFRHLAATLVLHERPGDIGLVRDLLGHRDARTTAHLYAGVGTCGAAAVYGAMLERARSARNADIASQADGASPRLS